MEMLQIYRKCPFGQWTRLSHCPSLVPRPFEFILPAHTNYLANFPTESLAVNRARMGLNIHHNKLPNTAVLVMILLVAEVSCLLSKVS